MSILLQTQKRFARQAALLILKAYELGYEVTLGDAFRDPRAHGKQGFKVANYGEAFSAHKIRCALDLNLFKDGQYLESTEDHRPLGEWWKAQGPDHAWGGDWNDGNHYSIKHNGIK